jgi:hypothetical protein
MSLDPGGFAPADAPVARLGADLPLDAGDRPVLAAGTLLATPCVSYMPISTHI